MKKLCMILPLALIICFTVGCQDKDKGKTLLILRKQSDGSWLIAIFSYSTDLPYPSS